MKYFPIIIVLLASVFFASNQFARNTQIENTDIQLHFEGYASNWIYLQSVHKNVKSKLDSTFVNADGNAIFKYDKPLEQGYYNIIISEDISFPMLIDRDQTFHMQTNINQLIESMIVEGSRENTLLYQNLQFDNELQQRFQSEVADIQNRGEQLDQNKVNLLREKYFGEKDAFLTSIFKKYPNSLFTKYEKAKLEPEMLNKIIADQSIEPAQRQEMMLSHFWDNVDFSDARLLRTPVMYDKTWQYFTAYVPNQTELKIQAIDVLMEKVLDYPEYNEFFTRWIADDYMPPYTAMMDPEAIYVHMVDQYITKERASWADSTQLYAYQLRVKERRVNLVGMKAGNIEAKDPQGETRSLYDVEAPYVALFFYHYDCDHCIEETPKLVAQYKALKDQGLEVFAVAMDTPDEKWKDFIKKNDMDWINVTDQDNQDIYDYYFIRATPEIILLNADRTIIGKHLSSDDLPIMIQMDRQGMLNNPN